MSRSIRLKSTLNGKVHSIHARDEQGAPVDLLLCMDDWIDYCCGFTGKHASYRTTSYLRNGSCLWRCVDEEDELKAVNDGNVPRRTAKSGSSKARK